MSTILLVEDSLAYQTMVKNLLGHHKIIIVDDPDEVISNLDNNIIDLVLLDITLPKRDGYTILHEIQGHSKHNLTPVICLTGKDQIADKVTAFSLGADDFIQKPFDAIEFRARIDGKLNKFARRTQVKLNLTVGVIVMDIMSHKIYSSDGVEISLTQTEFKLLHHFGKHVGNILSREQLLGSVWGDEGAVFDRAVDVHICSLRKKLLPYGLAFKSIPGFGYKLVVN